MIISGYLLLNISSKQVSLLVNICPVYRPKGRAVDIRKSERKAEPQFHFRTRPWCLNLFFFVKSLFSEIIIQWFTSCDENLSPPILNHACFGCVLCFVGHYSSRKWWPVYFSFGPAHWLQGRQILQYDWTVDNSSLTSSVALFQSFLGREGW